MRAIFSQYTTTGWKRKENQDRIGIFQTPGKDGIIYMAIVCDGLGGLERGAMASTMAVEGMGGWFQSRFVDAGIYDDENVSTAWKNVIEHINRDIRREGILGNGRMGTTLSALLLYPYGTYYIMHVGDSRIYCDNGRLQQLTEDQSLVEKEVREGKITPAQARTDSRRNILLQCVGTDKEIHPSFYSGRFKKGDSFLLCTDGFWHYTTEKEYCVMMRDTNMNSDTLKQHIELLEQRGETDNISAVIIQVK